MKRKLSIILLSFICACTFIFGLSACGTNSGNDGDGSLSQIVEITSVTLDVSEITLKAGESKTLKVTVLPENASDKRVTWQSLDPTVATVENGVVTALKEGVTVVTAVCGLRSANCIVTVTDGSISQIVEVTSVTLDLQSLSLQTGESRTLTATVLPETASNKTVTWQSLDPAVATVVNGRVTAIKQGATSVIAVCGLKSASCIVMVTDKPIDDQKPGISFDSTSFSMFIGESKKINATVNIGGDGDKTLTWLSSDEKVATVSGGMVKALKAGMSIIVATCGDYSASCTVVVTPVETTGITLDKTAVTVYIGDSVEVNANVLPENATDKTVLWSSLDASVARVVNGRITGVSAGSTVVTALCASTTASFTATCVVTVLDGRVTGLKFDKSKHSMYIGDSFTLTPTITPDYAKDKTVAWKSSDESIATVEDGVVTALSDGEVTITGKAGEIEAQCVITVYDPDPVTKIEVTGESSAFIDLFALSDYKLKITRQSGRTENIELKREYISDEDFAKLSTPGGHTLTVKYKTLDAQWEITIKNHDFEGVVFESETFLYDGSAKSVYVTGAPEGTEIVYENNGQTDLGEYTVTATLTKQYYNTKTLTATLKIEFNSFSEAELKSLTFLYDGSAKSLKVTGVPEGTRIDYTNNGQIEVGEYTVTAELTKTFYYTKTLTATLTIVLKERNITYVLGVDGVTNNNPEKFNVALGHKLSEPVRANGNDGKSFEGWYTDGNFQNKINEIPAGTYEDVTLYARWEYPYEVGANGALTATPFGKTLTEITIISEVNGVKVKTIDVSAFRGFDKLETVIILDGVTSIGNSAFALCSSLTSVSIPESVTSIGGNAFLYCGNLTEVNLPSKIIEIDRQTFSYCRKLSSINIPDGVTAIGYEAFGYCESLNGVILPESVTSIDEGAFIHCESLTEINIPKNITNIKNKTFSSCYLLNSVSIPGNITKIGEFAFELCRSLKSFYISENVVSIGKAAFRGCNSLTLTVSGGNGIYHLDGNCLIETATKTLIAGFKDSVIPADGSVTEIGYMAFSNLDITNITIPGCITRIGEYAFSSCNHITDVIIPNGVITIGEYAFSYCSELSSVTISASVTTIEKFAFYSYKNLKSVIFENPNWNYINDSGEEIIIPPMYLENPSRAVEWIAGDRSGYEWRRRN